MADWRNSTKSNAAPPHSTDINITDSSIRFQRLRNCVSWKGWLVHLRKVVDFPWGGWLSSQKRKLRTDIVLLFSAARRRGGAALAKLKKQHAVTLLRSYAVTFTVSGEFIYCQTRFICCQQNIWFITVSAVSLIEYIYYVLLYIILYIL